MNTFTYTFSIEKKLRYYNKYLRYDRHINFDVTYLGTVSFFRYKKNTSSNTIWLIINTVDPPEGVPFRQLFDVRNNNVSSLWRPYANAEHLDRNLRMGTTAIMASVFRRIGAPPLLAGETDD